jgi:ABC-2 type transport system permease protein
MARSVRPARTGGSKGAVLRAFWAVNVAEETQYRANFIVSLLATTFWLATALLTLAIFFRQTSSIGGWSFWEVVVLLGVFNALGGIVEALFRPSIGKLAEYVRTGSLDLILVRPIDPQFHVSFRRIDLWKSIDVLLGFGLAAYALVRLDALDPLRIAGFGLVFAAACVLIYTFWLALMSLAFWLVDVENLAVLFDALYESARYPAAAYPGALRFLFVYLVPIVWTTTIPASMLTGRLPAAWGAALLVASGVALIAVRVLWRAALRRYTSAGG